MHKTCMPQLTHACIDNRVSGLTLLPRFELSFAVVRGTEFVVLSEKNKKSTIVLLGPGPNNSLGMIPGSLQISDGNNMVSITNPGYQAMIEN